MKAGRNREVCNCSLKLSLLVCQNIFLFTLPSAFHYTVSFKSLYAMRGTIGSMLLGCVLMDINWKLQSPLPRSEIPCDGNSCQGRLCGRGNSLFYHKPGVYQNMSSLPWDHFSIFSFFPLKPPGTHS